VEAEKQEFVLDPPVVIRGRVVSEAGEPLSDVTVTGSAQSDEVAVTGPGGRFAIREPRWEDPLSFDAEDIFSVEKALSEFDQGKETTVIVAKRPRLACTVLDPAGVPVFVSTLETIWDGSCDGVDGSLFTDRNGRAELRPVDTCVLNLPLVVLPPPYLAKRHCLPILRPPPVFGEQEAVLQFESGRSVSVVAASDTGEAVEPYFSLPAATDEEFGYLPRIQADLDAENEVVLTPLPIDTVEVKISDVPFLPDDARFEIPAGATEVFIELSPAGVKLCTRDEFKRKGRFR
jgi:hypothetical protein